MQSEIATDGKCDQELCQEVVVGNRLHPLQGGQLHTLREEREWEG